jgi:NAD(P)-dependent dehydrogenase (short-subunit alcohol dehydrogenase family)
MKKSILISGANGDIGQALCEIFTSNGFYVIATDRQDICKCKCDVYLPLNLATYPKNNILRNKLKKNISIINQTYKLFCIINNAAVQIVKKVEEITPEDLIETYNVNLFSPIFILQDLLAMLKENRGNVINISSVHSNLTKPNFSSYASSKAALSSLTRALAIEIGEMVRVNAIEPGAIETSMLREGFLNKSEKLKELKNYQPLKKIGQPKDIARLALNIACDYDLMNGANIQMDGGISACLHDPN